MGNKKALKMMLGAAALGAIGPAFAVTSAGANGTIVLAIDDLNSNSGYTFDTGQKISAFTGSGQLLFTISGTNLTSFLGTVAGTDTVEWDVFGAAAASLSTGPVTIDTTSVSGQPAIPGQSNASTGNTAIRSYLGTVNNPNGADSFQPGASLSSWNAGGSQGQFTGTTGIHVTQGTGNTGSILLGTGSEFYQVSAVGQSGHSTVGATSTDFNGMWEIVLNSASQYVLEYNPSVPLPAPLLLLLSGLGLTGLVARRGKSSALAAPVAAA
ncbi:MAG: hypothetical protein JO203_10435 [Gammaproteobacteria bacterium]|nr:hypothetical protein [Gammaproteobacteria bacterium]